MEDVKGTLEVWDVCQDKGEPSAWACGLASWPGRRLGAPGRPACSLGRVLLKNEQAASRQSRHHRWPRPPPLLTRLFPSLSPATLPSPADCSKDNKDCCSNNKKTYREDGDDGFLVVSPGGRPGRRVLAASSAVCFLHFCSTALFTMPHANQPRPLPALQDIETHAANSIWGLENAQNWLVGPVYYRICGKVR